MPIPRPCFKALAVAWTILILIGTLLPQNELVHKVEAGRGLMQIPHFDKIVHFAMFAGFVLVWWLAVESTRARFVVILASAVFLGILTEAGQMIPMLGRDAGLDDLVADVLGCVAAGAGLVWLARRRTRATASA